MNILPLTQWIRNAAAALSFSFGSVSEQARHAGCSRQTVYQHAHKVLSALEQQQQGCPRCQQLLLENQQLRRDLQDAQQRLDQAIDLGPPRQLQLAILLCALGVSINQTLEVFLLLLTKAGCPGRSTIGRWLRKAGQDAGQVLTVLDSQTQPAVRVLAPDEIFFHGQPTLVAVEPASQALLLCTRAANRTGATWAAALQPFVNLEVVVSDAGTGLAAGLQAFDTARREHKPAELPPSLEAFDTARPEHKPPEQPPSRPLDRCLDVFHTEKEAQTILARLWRTVERAWAKAEVADRRVAKDKEEWYDARGTAARARAAWNQVDKAFAEHQRAHQAWQRAKAALALWRADGQLNDRAWAEQEIAAACQVLEGDPWRKVRGLLQDHRALVFLDRLHHRLETVEPRGEVRRALVELVGLEQAARAGGVVATGMCLAQRVVSVRLVEEWQKSQEKETAAGSGAGPSKETREDWQQSYARVAAELAGVVRASSVVECVNSVLRMHQGRHRGMSQGLLDLKRLYWNTRVRKSGRRKGQSPYQILGVPLPSDDFWTLLQGDPGKRVQQVSTVEVAA
jgi:hypothetical protein